MTASAPPSRAAGREVGPPSTVGLAPPHDAFSAGELLEMVARGGEDLDPDLTPAGDYLKWL